MKLLSVLFIFLPVLASAEESFICSGNLKVFGINGKKPFVVSAGQEKFVFDRSQLLALAFMADQKMPVLKVYPWNGIHWVDISSKVPGAQLAKPQVKTDGERWFAVEIHDIKNHILESLCEARDE